MKAIPIGGFKRARVVEDPIGANQPNRLFVLRNTPVSFPYSKPYPKEYPIVADKFKEYARLDYQLGYDGRIVLDELKTKGIFSASTAIPSFIDTTYKPKDWFSTLDGQIFLLALLANQSLTIKDDKKARGIFKLFLGKPQQIIFSARVAHLRLAFPADVIANYPFSGFVGSGSSGSSGSSATEKPALTNAGNAYYRAKTCGLNTYFSKTLINPRTKVFGELYEVIKNNARLLQAKRFYYWKDQRFPFINADDGTYDIENNKDIIRLFENVNTIGDSYAGASRFFVAPLSSITRIDGDFKAVIEQLAYRYSGVSDSSVKEIGCNISLFNGNLLFDSNNTSKVENVCASNGQIVKKSSCFDITLYKELIQETVNSKTRKEIATELKTKELGLFKIVKQNQEVLWTSYFEDQTADEESVDFLSDSNGLYDNDFYSNYSKGGTANYYAVQPFFGWDTIANNPDLGSKKSEVLKLRTRKDVGSNTIAQHMDSIITLAVNTTKNISIGSNVDGIPSLLGTGDIKSVELETKTLLNEIALRAVSIERHSLVFLRDFKGVGFEYISSVSQPLYLLSSEVDVDYVSALLNDDLIVDSKQLFYKSSALSNSLYESDAVIDYYPSNVGADYFAPSISVNVNNSFVSSYFKDIDVGEANGYYFLSSFKLSEILQVESNALLSSFSLQPDKQESSANFLNSGAFVKIPNVVEATFDKQESSFYFYSFYKEELSNTLKQDEWLPTGTWADLKGEPATYFLTFNKIDLTKQNRNPIIKLFLDKPISYIDIWRPYYYTSTGDIVLEIGDNPIWNRGGLRPYNWIFNLLQNATAIKFIEPTRKIETLMQVGYGYTTPPDVTIDARGLDKETLVDVLGLEIPPVLSFDIKSNRVFEEGSIDIRKYKLPIIDRAKVEFREFKEWIEESGEALVFIYGHTYTFHIYTSLQFEGQTFIGCAAKGLKIIGSMPKIPL